MAGLQLLFSWLMTWPIRATNGVANWVLRKLGVEPAQELRSARSAQELVSLVRTSARSGSLDPATAALLDRSLRFGELTAEELMTPRSRKSLRCKLITPSQIWWTPPPRGGFSRFPVVDGDLDETVGIVHVKQVFEVPPAERALTLVTAVAQPVAKVPSTLDGDAVMAEIRANSLQTAMVVDEYGGTAGMVTVEDLIEEIVGDVRDEHDDATPDVVATGDGWRVSGLLRIDEVATATGYHAPEGEYETIGGLVMQQLGRIPAIGDEMQLDGYELDGVPHTSAWRARVLRMDGRRVDLLELTQLPDHADSAAARGR